MRVIHGSNLGLGMHREGPDSKDVRSTLITPTEIRTHDDGTTAERSEEDRSVEPKSGLGRPDKSTADSISSLSIYRAAAFPRIYYPQNCHPIISKTTEPRVPTLRT